MIGDALNRTLTALGLSAAFCLPAGGAQADPGLVTILAGSYHVGASEDFESLTPGVFLTWQYPVVDLSAGVYRNSYGRASVAGTVDYPVWDTDWVTVAGFAGISYYPEDGRTLSRSYGDLVPIAGLRLRVGHALLTVIPSDGTPVDAIVTLGATFELE